MEKEQYVVEDSSEAVHDPESLETKLDTHHGALKEAGELYGDQVLAEQYGYVARG